MNNRSLKKLTLSALFIAIGLILPMFTGEIPQIGNMLLPMHIPVLLCGLICGWQYGLAVGLILPPLSSMLFGMPPMFPTAAAMAFELVSYGCIIGLLYAHSRWRCMISLYRSMIVAMIAGRAVWGIVTAALLGISGGSFTWQAFIAGAFLNAVPGIILQLVLIPSIMVALDRTKLVPLSKKPEHEISAEN